MRLSPPWAAGVASGAMRGATSPTRSGSRKRSCPAWTPDDGWRFRSYTDIGEHGFGLLASQLRPGVDGPEKTLMRGRIAPAGADGPRRSIWTVEEAPVAEEGPISAEGARGGPEVRRV